MKRLNIHIHELGPVRNAKIELAPVMIFTGASNLGKSYTNFLTYYIFNLFSGDRLTDFFRARMPEEANAGTASFSFSAKELEAWMEQDVRNFFAYLLNYPDVPCKVEFCFDNTDTVFQVKVKQAQMPRKADFGNFIMMEATVNDTGIVFFSRNDEITENTARHIAGYLQEALLDVHINRAYLLPPGRASLLNESFSIKKDVSSTGMYDIFLNDFDYIVNLKIRNSNAAETGRKRNESLALLTEKIIGGKLESSKEGIVMNMKGHTGRIPVSAAASSIKELSPLLLWAENGKPEADSMCIEEPEAHAHPDMQYTIADLLAACMMRGTLMQITTHSDYLLARLNQLIRLHNLKEKDGKRFKEVCKDHGINENLTLDSSLVNAYYFHRHDETQEVIIEKLDVKDGIPFDTFSNAVQEQIDWNEIFDGEQKDETV